MWLHRMKSKSFIFGISIGVLLFMLIPDLIEALSNVSVTVPLAVKRGDNAILICNYDLENETLYTVKWYRGRREFYRYTPKENPAWKIFHQAATNGITVETEISNASHVFLRNVPLSISGKYACEVSADQPTFHTSIASAEMDVVELPTQRPIITGIHSRYRLGDIVNGNCSSDYSKPAANLTWWINDIQAHPHYIRHFEVQKHLNENLESIVMEINFVVTLHHFIKGRLKLKCSAKIHNIYAQEAEKILEEDRPRILASGRSPDMNMYPFDHPTDGEGHFDDEMYLTRYKDTPSKAAYSTKSTRLCKLLAIVFLFPIFLNDFIIKNIIKPASTTVGANSSVAVYIQTLLYKAKSLKLCYNIFAENKPNNLKLIKQNKKTTTTTVAEFSRKR